MHKYSVLHRQEYSIAFDTAPPCQGSVQFIFSEIREEYS